MKLKNGDKIGIVACSNGQPLSYKTKIEELLKVITEIGLTPVCSDFIFQKYSVFSGSPKERAKALLKFYPMAIIRNTPTSSRWGMTAATPLDKFF
ncbi:LD-carboxypeptidase [Clostridium algidicarnis]|uniref:LD-carboxypeptidase n=1 Tax=Clostridium algidicarnis TaxID=37659 RepID=UPI001C0DD7A4|nr:LD-carboxypeptidase [Clostridium algidicarnis]MBU3196752.1 LD-carboxypeptidase [Clostridium algidicarnis]MBU3227821.1 LD-carboxypeptidase [Clostridium algidicarnis]MBU3251571.1 LD-carboxypeptidase [Clostridium algidicarnis]